MYRRKILFSVSAFLLGILLALHPSTLSIRSVILGGSRLIIPQNGMYPSLLKNNSFFCDKYSRSKTSNIAYGDIVAFKKKDQQGQEYIYVWRVVALPRDSIVVDETGVRINGQLLDRKRVRVDGDFEIHKETNNGTEYLIALDPHSSGKRYFVAMQVPEHHVFLLGDNRDHAADSRIHGAVPLRSIFCRKRNEDS